VEDSFLTPTNLDIKCFKHFLVLLVLEKPNTEPKAKRPEPDLKTEFTSREVVALTGITPRQLQWWDERGIVVPARAGRRRLYSMEDLSEVAVICELRQRGFSLQRMRKVVRFLQREFGKRLAETVGGASDYHLLTDGTHLYLETSAQQIVDILKNARQPMLAVCLSDTVRRVRAEIHSRKKQSRSAAQAIRPAKRGKAAS
jgi:DNA-binding transcriptional MerR regulator